MHNYNASDIPFTRDLKEEDYADCDEMEDDVDDCQGDDSQANAECRGNGRNQLKELVANFDKKY